MDYITITVYPNPAKDRIQLQTNFAGIKDITIMNAGGQLVAREQISATGKELNIEKLKSGVYFLTIYVKGEKKTVQFVKN